MAGLIFPIDELLEESRAYEWLVARLHPEGLDCPAGHPLPGTQAPHTRNRDPVVEYRCQQCGCVFNVFTGTALTGIRLPCSKIVLMLRGFLQGTPTLHLAQELAIDRMNLLRWRHHLQALIDERFSPLPAARQGDGSGRNVPKRWRKGHSAS
jgi:transposase-like protein